MGDDSSRQESRVPRLGDLVRLCRSLNESGARYVIVGGFAVILHGYARGTMDIDLLVDPSPGNVAKVKKALSILSDNAAAEVADEDVGRYIVVRVADEIVVDLMAKAGGIAFERVAKSALRRDVEGVSIPFADERDLILTKDTVRPKDKQDALFLRRKLEGGK